MRVLTFALSTFLFVAAVREPERVHPGFGAAVGSIGDFDGDGAADILVVELGARDRVEFATVVSGDSGLELGRIERAGSREPVLAGGPVPPPRSGTWTSIRLVLHSTIARRSPRVAFGDDDDGDGVRERWNVDGAVLCRGSKRGAVLRSWTVPYDRYADYAPCDSVIALGDVNADSRTDLAVASRRFVQGGVVWVLSGAGLGVVRSFHGGEFDWNVGPSLAALGDVDGDHVPDFVVGSDNRIARELGTAHVISGRTGELVWRITRVDGRVHGSSFAR